MVGFALLTHPWNTDSGAILTFMGISAEVGGKGANLAILREAGLPVPPFVVLQTSEYDAFVAAAGLAETIKAALSMDPTTAASVIATAFSQASISPQQRAELLTAVAPLADGPVAIRSSATAEDLSGMSFAGQYDSFLNVNGTQAILEAVVACWASLWTERVISYRAKASFDVPVSMAVIVQTMVSADAGGVLFTANPQTGRRDETVVEAAPGQGDGVVSGKVVPDNYVLDPISGCLRRQTLAGPSPTLTTSQLERLVTLGRRVAELYGVPIDLEWAAQGDELFVVQARPITGLYPLPPANPKPHATPEVWLSVGAFQGVLEPLTPLGQDALSMLLSAAPRVLGRRVGWRANRAVQVAGERLWLRVDGLLRTRATRTLLTKFLPLAEPGSAAILASLGEEPELRPAHNAPKATTMAALAAFGSRVASRGRANVHNPDAGVRHLNRVAAGILNGVRTELVRAARAPSPQGRLTARAQALSSMADHALPSLLPAFAPIMLPSMRQLGSLRELAAKTDLPGADALAMNVMRALPGNVTTEMCLRLADAAAAIKSDANAWGWVTETPAQDLARQYLNGGLPRIAQQSLSEFLACYGMRGVAEIDLGAPCWRDDPTAVIHALKSYLARPATQPREDHLAGQHEAGRSIRTLMDASTSSRAEKIRRAAKAIRGLAGARETPKFTLIQAFGLIREALEVSAAELVEQGRLGHVSDLAFLRFEETTRAFSADWHEVVATRRAVWQAEKRRTQVPRILVEDGRAFYDGLGASTDGDLGGVGVSPGIGEGLVRIVRDPRTTTLAPGEILVCPGTDPAWTPLFLTAVGLITEVGGLMTHGSVVAREYGIPAVVGVHGATTRLTDGQRVRIDGASGTIEIV